MLAACASPVPASRESRRSVADSSALRSPLNQSLTDQLAGIVVVEA
jgi:hypothetical protein